MKQGPEGSRDRVGGRKGASVYPWENGAAKEQVHGINNAPTTKMHTRDFLRKSDQTIKCSFFFRFSPFFSFAPEMKSISVCEAYRFLSFSF